jgi:hypothetical protein
VPTDRPRLGISTELSSFIAPKAVAHSALINVHGLADRLNRVAR